MLNVRFVCWRVNVFFTMTWLQHKVLVPDKHRVYFPVLEEILNFLTLPFSIHLPRIISFRFLLFLKAVIVCSWNSSRKVLLVLRMFQFLRPAVVRFGKSWLYLILMECVLNLVVLNLFLVVDCLLKAYQLFLTFLQNLSISFPEWWTKSSLVEKILFIRSVWLYGMMFFYWFWMFWVDVKKGLLVRFLSKYFGIKFIVFNVYFGIQNLNSFFRYFIFKFNWWVFWV